MEFTNLIDNKSKVLHLNVIGTKEEVEQNLNQFGLNLAMLQEDRNELKNSYVLPNLDLAGVQEHEFKKSDILGLKSGFEIAHFGIGHKGTDSALFAYELAKRLNPLEVIVDKDKELVSVDIPSANELLVFNGIGRIKYARDKSLRGKDALLVISSYAHQDIGILKSNGHGLVYTFDSSMFEKTPKDPITGHNEFIGRNAMLFHGKAKTFGNVLPGLFMNMAQNFENEKLEGVIIDLKGAHQYSNGEVSVRRFERDYVVPVLRDGNLKGIIAYADVFFQDASGDVKSPFDGGSFLKIEDPAKFHREFKVILNEQYKRPNHC